MTPDRIRIAALSIVSLASLAGSAGAAVQSNATEGLDLRFHSLNGLHVIGREGSFPNGVSALAGGTTLCNVGTVSVPWQAPMAADHPLYATLVVRESDGRLVQISRAENVKHGIFPLPQTQCGACRGGFGSFLAAGCSSTSGVATMGDLYTLAPADEVDPWTGLWDRVCSLFDAGEPPVAAPADCDGIQDFTFAMSQAQGSVARRTRVSDADLLQPGGFRIQSQVLTQGEPEAARSDNLLIREFVPIWTGASWNLQLVGGRSHGSVLSTWDGASVSSATNGDDDGRIYVAHRVTGPENGLYHYEYAIHNRDNARGVGGLRIPLCSSATVVEVGFRDADGLPGSDWTMSLSPTELEFSTGDNPLRWNHVYNFWFDSDAAPRPAPVRLEAFEPGPGASFLNVSTRAPLAAFTQASALLGEGCGEGAAPRLRVETAPGQGGDVLRLASSGNGPGRTSFLLVGTGSAPRDLGGGCQLWLSGSLGAGIGLASVATTDGQGLASHDLDAFSSPAFEGLTLAFQAVAASPLGSGPVFGRLELSNGLLVRLGANYPACP